MAYHPHALVSFTGTWTYTDTTQESWMFGVRIAVLTGGDGSLTDPGAYIATVGPTLKAWFANTSNQMANKAALNLIKCNNINSLGHYADSSTHSYDAGGQLGGTITAMPVTQCLAITWGTGRSSGRARHGRIYPPVALASLGAGTGATAASGAPAIFVAAGKALLSLLHVTTPTESVAPTPVVVSDIDGSCNPITQVSCDSRLDLQRRRSRQVAGVRTVAAWP